MNRTLCQQAAWKGRSPQLATTALLQVRPLRELADHLLLRLQAAWTGRSPPLAMMALLQMQLLIELAIDHLLELQSPRFLEILHRGDRLQNSSE
ncbi:unnamed protein product [Lota lota]